MRRNLRIVLVEPREAGNVGAAARAMKNFGFERLRIVGDFPRAAREAEWWSSGAADVVESAERFDSLEEALADCHLTIATTSGRGRGEGDVPLLPLAVAELFAGRGEAERVAIVFGREDHGLNARELALCQWTATIPTSPGSPVMNLAQAVSIFCYELSLPRKEREADVRDRPAAAELERLHEAAKQLLLDSGFLHANNPDRIYDELRRILTRADLDARELTILLGAVRQLQWAVKEKRGGRGAAESS